MKGSIQLGLSKLLKQVLSFTMFEALKLNKVWNCQPIRIDCMWN